MLALALQHACTYILSASAKLVVAYRNTGTWDTDLNPQVVMLCWICKCQHHKLLTLKGF